MTYRRVILPGLRSLDTQEGMTYLLSSDTVHYLFRVLRMNDGSWVEACNGTHQSWLARLVRISEQQACLQEWQPLTPSVPLFPVYLAQGMPKGEKWETILQKGTELGISGFVPFFSSRCVVRPKPEKDAERLVRWQRIVQEASRQCHRSDVPEVIRPIHWEELHDHLPPALPRLVCWEGEPASLNNKPSHGREDLRQWCAKHPALPGVVVAVGPEGGWSSEEILFLHQQGFHVVGLGPLILRTETAGPFVAGLLQYLYGVLGGMSVDKLATEQRPC